MFRLTGLRFGEQKKKIHLFLLNELKIWIFEKRSVSRASRPDSQNNERVILMILPSRPYPCIVLLGFHLFPSHFRRKTL